MKTGNEFCTIEKFRELFQKSRGSEFELSFSNTKAQYMIYETSSKISFARCSITTEGSDEFFYKDLNELFEKGEVDGFVLKENWQYLYAIIIDSTFELDEYCEKIGIQIP